MRKMKIYKHYNLHPATIRALLKKKGYKIGCWGNNGRIKGLANFYGGNLEVKEYQLDYKFQNGDNLHNSCYLETVCVEIEIWEEKYYKKININKLKKELRSNGYIILKNHYRNNNKIIVKNKWKKRR